MELRWYRDQPSQVVHLHKNGMDVKEEQMREYEGRTTFLSAGLDHGKATVRIHNVTGFDNGTFHCNFKDGIMSDEAKLWLMVAGKGTLLHSWSPHVPPPKLMISAYHPIVAKA